MVRTTPSPSGSTILVVSKRTGLPMQTLRAWERRYGFPRPERRPGSNRRLYASADIERLLAIKRVLDLGYRIGDVIQTPLSELDALAGARSERAREHVPADGVPDVRSLIEILKRDESDRLNEEVRRMGALLGPRRFVTDLAQPLAVALGDAWMRGEISVRHEHVATECLLTSLRAMLADLQVIHGRPVVMLASLPGELHGLGLVLVAVYLAVSGAKPQLLGPSIPAEEIIEATRAFGADVVGLTVSGSSDLDGTGAAVGTLRRRLPTTVPVWIGGGGAEALHLGGRSRGRIHTICSWEALDQALKTWRTRREGDVAPE